MCSVVAGTPVLVLSGEHDRVVASQKSAAAASLFPGSVSRLVPGCGHLPHEETPSVLVSLLTTFVSEVIGKGVPSKGVTTVSMEAGPSTSGAAASGPSNV